MKYVLFIMIISFSGCAAVGAALQKTGDSLQKGTNCVSNVNGNNIHTTCD